MKNTRIHTLIVCLGILLLTACTEVTNITLNSTEITMVLGQTELLTATLDGKGNFSKQPITWTSSNSHVKVTDGKLVAVSTGSAIITAQSGDAKATCNVTVGDEIVMNCNDNAFVYFGDEFKTNNTTNFGVLVLASKTDTIVLHTLIPGTSTTLTDGEYRLYSINNINDVKPYRIFRGFLNSGNKVNSWLFGRVTSAITIGKIIVSRIEENYTIDIDVTDEYGNRIYGSYEGALYYEDRSSSQIKTATNKTQMSPLSEKVKAIKTNIFF